MICTVFSHQMPFHSVVSDLRTRKFLNLRKSDLLISLVVCVFDDISKKPSPSQQLLLYTKCSVG